MRNATISILRPGAPGAVGVISGYRRDVVGTETVLIEDWPVSMLDDGRGHDHGVGLPISTQQHSAEILMPCMPGVAVAVSDAVNDQLGRRWKVMSFEATELGWRIRVTAAGA